MNQIISPPGVPLTTDLSSDGAFPYFLWDEPMTMNELFERLQRSDAERMRLLGKIMREARDKDVWLFTTPAEVSQRWADLQRYLGKRRDFWVFLLNEWRAQGLLS
ncbi:MAG: hypothetical protein ACREMY_22745 [bacterium]